MKNKVLSVVLIIFFAIGLAACSSANMGNTNGNSSEVTSEQTPAVSIENMAFNPAVLTVEKGTTVVWTNNDSAVHNVNSTAFNSPDFKKGETFKFTFETVGTYDYSCGIHPAMTGQIIVVEE